MIHDIVVGQFSKSLQNLSKILDKAAAYAEAKKFETDVLVHSRLAPDMFSLVRQVQITCDTAKNGAARLAGKEAPVFEDKEQTLPELKARIETTTNYLKTFTPKDFTESAQRRITQPRWNGKYLTGQEFLLHHMMPNFFFHSTTAYDILRHNGVDVGKGDYLGEMPYKS